MTFWAVGLIPRELGGIPDFHCKAAAMIREIHEFGIIEEMESKIPEFSDSYTGDRIRSRLEGREYLALIYEDQGKPVAYKVGYAETPTRFYSWIGGVLPAFRRLGLARRLLRYQEDWCAKQGYTEVKVWSENRYRQMLIFLLNEDYDIFAVSGEGQIMFRKLLTPPE